MASKLSDAAEPRKKSALREWFHFLLLALSLFAARSVFADFYQVPTGSMIPTILEGDRVFVLKCAYQIRFPFTSIRLAGTGAPERGDVVVLRNPDGGRVPLVKRVVGLPGDLVELRNERLFVNGAFQPLRLTVRPAGTNEDRELRGTENLGGRFHPVQILPFRPAMRSFGPLRVPAGEVFVMGDNRDNSRDGRYFGPRPISDLLGKAEGVFWSWNRDLRKGPRWNRFFRPFPARSDS